MFDGARQDGYRFCDSTVPLFPGKPEFCRGNFLDPLATKAGDAKQERAVEQVVRQILRRASAFIALPLHLRKAAARLLAVNAIAETASVSIAID
jgi:arsenate reductase